MAQTLVASSGASGVVGCSVLVALLLRRLWRVQVAAATHRRRHRRHARAWVELLSTWHAPLLLLGLAIAVTRLAFFVEMQMLEAHNHHHYMTASPQQQRRLWLWLELPSALVAIATAYLVFFHAHVVLFRVWPIRMDSTAMAFRLLLGAFTGLLLTVVVLLAYAREMRDPVQLPQQWTRLSLSYFAAVWIVLGALLLKLHGQSAEIMWAERAVGRLLVISPRGLHRLVAAEALLSLVVIARGTMLGMLTVTARTPNAEPLLPSDPSKLQVSTFISLYGIWELVALGVLYYLCRCVPVVSRARRLVGYPDEEATRGPIVEPQPVLYFTVPSPKRAVEDYIKSAAVVFHSHTRRPAHHSFNRHSDDEPSMVFDAANEDTLLSEEGSFHEPLLSNHTESEGR